MSSLSSSVIQINPDLPQCHELSGWYADEGSNATTQSLTTAGNRGAGGDMGANTKTFGETKKENLGLNSDKPEYYSNTAYVTLIPKDKALYMACGNQLDGRTCNKKVRFMNNHIVMSP